VRSATRCATATARAPRSGFEPYPTSHDRVVSPSIHEFCRMHGHPRCDGTRTTFRVVASSCCPRACWSVVCLLCRIIDELLVHQLLKLLIEPTGLCATVRDTMHPIGPSATEWPSRAQHLTLKKEATKPVQELPANNGRGSIASWNAHNHERPHQALDMRYPAELYSASSREYRGLTSSSIPFTDRTTAPDSSWHRRCLLGEGTPCMTSRVDVQAFSCGERALRRPTERHNESRGYTNVHHGNRCAVVRSLRPARH
jgi:hypothetical protein